MEKQESVLADGYSCEVKFIIPPEDYLEKANEELRKIRRKIRIPGFRPGHVPLHLARKLVGEQFLYDTLWKIVENELRETLKDKEGSLAGDPLVREAKISDIRWEKGGPAEIIFLIGTKPEIQLPESLDNPIMLPDVEISDQYVEDFLNRYAYEHGTYEDVDNPEEAQYFILNLLLNDKRVPFVVERNQLTEDLIQKLITQSEQPIEVKLGEDILVDVEQFWNNVLQYVNQYASEDRELRRLINQYEGSTDLNVSLSKMQVFKPMELNLENLKRILIPRYAEKVKDEQDAKQLIKEQLKYDLIHAAYRRALTELLDKLRRELEIPVPEEYLKALAQRKLKESSEGREVTEEEVEVEADRLKDRLITDLLIGALLKKFGIKINSQDVIDALAKHLYYKIGLSEESTDEELEEYKELAFRAIEAGLEREDLWYERVLLDKIVKALLEAGWVERKSVPVEEFIK